MLELLLLLLPVAALIDWAVVAALVSVVWGVRPDGAMRFVIFRSVGIALVASVYAGLYLADVLNVPVDPNLAVVLLVAPVYLLSGINFYLLLKIIRGTW